MRHAGSVQGHRNYLAEMPSVTTSGSGALQMLPLTVSGQPLEISLERLGQPMSLYVPLSKGTRGGVLTLGSIFLAFQARTPTYGLGEGSLVATGLFDVADQRMTD